MADLPQGRECCRSCLVHESAVTLRSEDYVSASEKGMTCVYSVSGSQQELFWGGYFTPFSLKLLLYVISTRLHVGFSSFFHVVNADVRPGMKSQVHALPSLSGPCSSCGLGLLDGLPHVKKSLKGVDGGCCWMLGETQ